MRLIIFIFLMSALLLTSCSSLKIQSVYRKQAVTIDGKSGDWAHVPLIFNETPPMMIGAQNDSSVLEIVLVFRNSNLLQVLLRRGFSIWFDEDEQFGIDYMGRMPSLNENGYSAQNEPSYSGPPPGFHSLNSSDFTAIDQTTNRYMALQDIKNLAAALSLDHNNYCLELRIPLTGEERDFGAMASDENQIMLKIKSKESNRHSKTRAQRMMGIGKRGGRKRSASGRDRGQSDIEWELAVVLAK